MSKIRKSITIWLPNNLEIDLLITNNPPDFSYKLDYFKYIINLIIVLKTRYRKFSKKIDSDVCINSKLLKSLISNYHKYISYLIDNGVIECDNSYVVGKRSKSYRLAKQYRTIIVKQHITSSLIIKRITNWYRKRYENDIKQYPSLFKWFQGLQLDSLSSNIYMSKLLNEYCILDNRRKKKRVINKLNSYNIMLQLIRDKDYYFIVDTTANRLHTNLSNLKKDLRNYLSFNGKCIVSIDLCCSQPCLSTILFNVEFYKSKINKHGLITIHDVINVIQDRLKHIVSNSGHINPMCVDLIQCLDNQKTNDLARNDMNEYILMVSNGTFYEHIQSKINEVYGVILTRDEAKKLIITIFFADDTDHRPDFVRNRIFFEMLFPTVYKFFKLIKARSYPTLAILLQKIEAVVFLDRIVPRLTKEHPRIPLFTVHDSICTTVEYKDVVHNLVSEEITKAIGIKPNLKLEYWADNSNDDASV